MLLPPRGLRRWSVAKKAVKPAKKEYRIVRYFKEVRAELRRVVWPSRRTTIRLTSIVFGVTVAMSLALGLIDWIFTQVFTLIIG
jgi:preprotein translocase subunit SecE